MSTAGLLDTRASRVLAIAGLVLIIAGMTFGDVFAIFILHPTVARIGEAMYAAAQAVSAGDSDAVLARFQTIGGLLESRGSKIAAHNHAVILGFLAVMLAFLQASTSWTPAAKLRLAWIYVACAILLPIAVFAIHYVGLAHSPFAYFGWASIVANTAGLVMAVVVILQLLGLWRSRGKMVALDFAIRDSMTHGGRILLAGGLLLLLGGFLFGFGTAAYFKYLGGVDEAALLRDIVSHAAAGQSFDADFAAYGGMQAVRGVIAAAHAHVNTMGLLLLVLVPVQALVSLSHDWQRRWALALVVSSFVTPLCILLELKLGLLAGRMADVSGAISIASLIAMLVGVLRSNTREAPPECRPASRESWILIPAGIALIAVAALYGVYYAFFDEHQTLVGMGTALATSFAQAAAGNLERAYAAIEQYRVLATEYRLEVHFHGHLGFLGIALVLLGFVVHAVKFGDAVRLRLALSLAVSALLFPAGALLQAGFAVGAGSLLAAIGAVGLVLGMAVFAVGALRGGTSPA